MRFPWGNTPDKLILLGTKDGPSVRQPWQVPSSNALIVDGVPYLIDAGYGASMRLIEKGINLAAVRGIFITHHHSDHNLELGPLIYNAWGGGLDKPVDVYGPAPIEAAMAAYLESNRFDLEIRIADEGRPDLRKLVRVHTYSEGVVVDNERMRVTALRNLHPPIDESYALKFELKDGKIIVFSGDTAYHPPLAEFASGADYLVHEVMLISQLEKALQRNPAAKTLLQHLRASHTSTEELGRLAAAAKPKNLVLTHFVPGGVESLTDEDWLRDVRAAFSGSIIVGKDGLEIPLG